MNGRKLLFIFLLTGAILMGWLAGWGFRKELTVQHANVDANLTDFPVYVKINADADFHESLATGFDIRFTQSDGTTLLKYEREYWTGGNGSAATAHFWVKVPSILAAGGTTFYIYYGKAGAADGEDAANVWDANFEGVWHLKESSNPYYDSTSNNNDSTSGTYPTQADGKIHKGQDFESSSSEYMVCGTNPISGTAAFTLEAWFKAESDTGTWGAVLCTGDDDTNESAYIGHIDNGNYGYGLYANNIDSGVAISVGTWKYIVFVHEGGGGGTYRGYVDAVQKNTSTWTPNLDNIDGTIELGHISQSNYYADGIIDEARLTSGVRSAAWIKFTFYNINEADQELTWAAEEAAGVTLIVADGTHGHSTDAIALIQAHVLAIAEALHGHSSDPITLFQAHQIAIDDALHGHLADLITLSQAHQLAVNGADHNHLADNIVLLTGALLVVADALHGHSVDNITLSQVHNLLVNAGLHSFASDPIILSQVHSLVVDGGGHAHLADNIALVLEGIVYATMGPQPRIEEDVIFIGTKEPTFIGKEGIIFISEDDN